jgi:hypothetical protein
MPKIRQEQCSCRQDEEWSHNPEYMAFAPEYVVWLHASGARLCRPVGSCGVA